MKNIVIASSFGHEIMACGFANAYGVKILIAPKKDNKEEYDAEAQRIYDVMSFFYGKMEIVPFEERENIDAWDIIGELKAGTLSDEVWTDFFKSTLTPTRQPSAVYPELSEMENILFVPQKLVSDGACGLNAAQQSLTPNVFNFLKSIEGVRLVLGQHFNKVADKPAVDALADDFGLYVPGTESNPDVYGIRGVAHEKLLPVYGGCDYCVGIAGTHTWVILACCPWVRMVVVANKALTEHWDAIVKAAKAAGRNVELVEFDENMTGNEIAERVMESCSTLDFPC
ncbi:MAG: hypothetical protein IJ870_02740 [Alphaproteobacteria bacterium]|nr:hypothetical protein [Alphaproteobacteria bacterium]